jgi:hypothetical protein
MAAGVRGPRRHAVRGLDTPCNWRIQPSGLSLCTPRARGHCWTGKPAHNLPTPVTPEVAGSSPVAPIKIPAKSRSGWGTSESSSVAISRFPSAAEVSRSGLRRNRSITWSNRPRREDGDRARDRGRGLGCEARLGGLQLVRPHGRLPTRLQRMEAPWGAARDAPPVDDVRARSAPRAN